MWEILTFGGRPYADKTTKEVVVAVNRGTRLNQPSTCSLDLYKNMLSCECLVCVGVESGLTNIPASVGSKHYVRLQRLLDYQVALSVVYYGDCPKDNGHNPENVGLLRCWVAESVHCSMFAWHITVLWL